MSSDLLSTAITGLRVSQAALSTTGHNISNASVDGYSRQVVHAETNPAGRYGSVYIGNGANVEAIERQVNEFITTQVRRDTTLFNELEAFNGSISQLDTLLSDVSTGMSGALKSFFSALQNGADDPTSIPARQLVISEADNLANRFNTVYGRLLSVSDGVSSAVETAVEEINALVNNIASLNQKIADAFGVNRGDPNDLLDQRDQALKELSKYIAFQTYDQGFGEVNVLIANGQNLVVGSEARQLDTIPNPNNASEVQVVFVGDVAIQPIENSTLGGELGGLFKFRDEALDQTYTQIGRIATVMADTFNQKNAIGINLDNQFGGSFFNDVNERSVTLERVIANSSNALPQDRVVSANVTDSSQLTLSEYRVELVNSGLYTVTRLSDNEEVVRSLLPGGFPFSAEFDGLELVFEQGTFQSGDQFTVQAVRAGARNFSNELLNPEDLAFALPLLTDSSIGNTGNARISPGDVLGLTAADGTALPLFATPGEMRPPMLVRFISDNVYEILDNTNPANPVALDPPITNQRYVPGINNELFTSDIGQTLVQMNGADIGLPLGSTPVIGGGPLFNNYPSENISITQPSTIPGAPPLVQTLTTTANASARTTASALNNFEGVSTSASTYAELSNTQNLSLATPLQINLNGEDLIEYEFDTGLGMFVVSPQVPDPTTDEQGFNDYLAGRINANSALSAAGIFAGTAFDSATNTEKVTLYSSVGDNLEVSLLADAGGPDTMNIGDGISPVVALNGNGPGVSSAIAVGGTIDVSLDADITLSTVPVVSGLFGDSSALDFAKSNYYGIQASITGTVKAGDTFTLGFNADAALDNRNALTLANLDSVKTIGGGVESYSESYSSLVEAIGIETSSSVINRNAAEQVLQQSEKQRNSVSGVNLDEEAADLIRFEQMYSANAQVISVARNLFDTLIGSF